MIYDDTAISHHKREVHGVRRGKGKRNARERETRAEKRGEKRKKPDETFVTESKCAIDRRLSTSSRESDFRVITLHFAGRSKAPAGNPRDVNETRQIQLNVISFGTSLRPIDRPT